MPRGYLKRLGRRRDGDDNRTSGISKKVARGGSSKKTFWYKTPRYVREWKSILRCQSKRELHDVIVDEIRSGFNDYYYCIEDDDINDNKLWPDVEGEEEVSSTIIISNNDNYDTQKKCYDSENIFESDFSFCDESFKESDDSFSLISQKMFQENGSLLKSPPSSASSLWEILSSGDLSRTIANDNNSTKDEGDSISTAYDFLGVSNKSHNNTENPKQLLLSAPRKCAICLDNKDNILRLMNKCNHPAACITCLQEHYVDHCIIAKDDNKESLSSSCFPLKCFWPGCNRTLRDTQIRRLVRNQNEMDIYYEKENEARETRKAAQKERLHQSMKIITFKTIHQCTSCGTSNPIYPFLDNFSFLQCTQCQKIQPITISLEDIKSIIKAAGEFLVNCPACERLIVKDGGCDEMICICGEVFSFNAAQVISRSMVYKNRSVQFRRAIGAI